MTKKITTYIKENFKLIIPLALIAVLFIAFFVYYKISILDNYREYKKITAIQYFQGKKYQYTATIGLNRKKEIVELSTKDYNINYDSTPIYYRNQNKAILPTNMSVVMPTLGCAQYLTPKYSLITEKKGNYYLKTTKYDGKLGHYFLYNGLDLYFFLDEATLNINNQKIKLGPLSYVYTNSSNRNISYYDKKKDIAKTIEAKDYKTTVENDYYIVNISTNEIDYFGKNVMLTSKITSLNTIDMHKKN
ncbi:MAG: hypothetical protein VZS44_04515 [Bacilli bacterium]|nr:hypothetical protein [Bacilli bacterium]